MTLLQIATKIKQLEQWVRHPHAWHIDDDMAEWNEELSMLRDAYRNEDPTS